MGDLYIEFNQPPQPISSTSQLYSIRMTMWD